MACGALLKAPVCAQVMASHHTLLDRQAVLLQASEPLTSADRELLQVRALL